MAMATDDAAKARWRKVKSKAESGRELLVERFPRAFCAKGQPKLPLKIGIYWDVRQAAPDLPARLVHLALRDYTAGRTYLRALQPGAERVDLDGWPTGKVSSEDAASAAAKLRAKQRSKRPRRRDEPSLLSTALHEAASVGALILFIGAVICWSYIGTGGV